MTSFKITIAMTFLSIILVLASPNSVETFFLWKTCMKVDSSFYHQIIDPDILEIGNDKYYAFVGVTCEGVRRHNAFSRCANGCPIFPNSSVKIARNKVEVCEGDIIFVRNDQCTLGKIKKNRWPNR